MKQTLIAEDWIEHRWMVVKFVIFASMDNNDKVVSAGEMSDLVLWARIIGMSACFAWSFFILPPTDAFDKDFWGLGGHELVRFLAVGVVPGALISLADRACLNKGVRLPLMWACCIARVAIMMIFLFAPHAIYGGASVFFIAVLGAANAFNLISWGCSLLFCGVDICETSFIRSFAITGCVIVIFSIMPSGTEFVFALFPIAEALLFAFVNYHQKQPISLGASQLHEGEIEQSDEYETQRFTWRALLIICLRTCCAVAFIAFSWAVFSNRVVGNLMPVMGVGFAASAGLVWLFSHLSSNVGFYASIRWALPLLAIGMALFTCELPEAIVLACLLFGVAQVGFETMLRMQIVHSAKRFDRRRERALGLGYASIMLGAFIGDAAYSAIIGQWAFPLDRLIVFLMAAMVILSVALSSGEKHWVDKELKLGGGATLGHEENRMPSDATYRSRMLSDRFSLSKREEEIAGYLLEGRSRPYIRDELHISISTVNTYVRHIYEKVGVNSLQSLIDVSKEEDALGD